jgi:hypothetical protein
MPCRDTTERISQELGKMQQNRIRFVVVLLLTDCYGEVKLAGDPLGLVTQCIRWKNIERTPRGFQANVLNKIHAKLGGTNHTLVSRAPASNTSAAKVFQDPPASISWLFDKPAMLIGIDVSHPEPGQGLCVSLMCTLSVDQLQTTFPTASNKLIVASDRSVSHESVCCLVTGDISSTDSLTTFFTDCRSFFAGGCGGHGGQPLVSVRGAFVVAEVQD